MLNMAIAKLMHDERQREIEEALRKRRLLEPDEEATWAAREIRDAGRDRRPAARQETAGAAS
jgi:hypothetical protein